MHNLEYKKDNLKTDSFLQHTLSIQFNLDGFSFWLKDKSSKEVILFKHFPLKLSNDSVLIKKMQQIIDTDEALQHQPTETKIIISASRYSVVPSNYFIPENAGEILEFIYGAITNSTVIWEFSTTNEYAIIFSISDYFRKIFDKKFIAPVYSHILHSLMDYAKFIGIHYEQSVLLCLVPGGVFLTLLMKAKIHFLNYFEYRHADDLNFYLFSVLRDFGISPFKIPVLVCGSADNYPISEIHGSQEMKVDFITRIPEDFNEKIFSKIPFHKFFNLLYT